MISPEILKKIQNIKIRTRRLMNGTSVGSHVTQQKGSGFEFDQIRAYEYGDDIRFVDWKSSARSGKLLVRQYLDEKNRTIMICLDVSASTMFGSENFLKSDVMQQISAALTFITHQEHDSVGLILFSETVEHVIPPSRGYKHVMHIIETIFSYRSCQKRTDLNTLFLYLVDNFKRDAAIFVISDFLGNDFEKTLKYVVCKREVIAIRCLDALEKNIPSVGYIWGQDPETNDHVFLNLSKNGSEQLQNMINMYSKDQINLFRNHNVDLLDVTIQDDFIKQFILFLKQRMMQK